MRGIFFEEKLGETWRNSEGGCEPHGQGWGASRTGRDGSGGSGGWGVRENDPQLTYSAIADNPEGGLAGKGETGG